MFTVEELLRDCCPELKVINDGADLSRTVVTADTTETPDVSDYIGENTLILTTGMAFQENPERLAEFIVQLNEKPVSALAIKLERFITEIPESVIEAANTLRFPILQIPKETTLGIVAHKILSYVWNSQAKTLSSAIEINREFSKYVLRNAPVSSLISRLSKMLNRSILFISPFLEIETSSILDDVDEQSVTQTITTIRSHYLEARHRHQRQRNLFYISKKDGRQFPVSVFPVMVDSYQKYLLAVFDAAKIPYPFSELVLEQVTIPIAFVQYKYQILTQSALAEKEKFFGLVCGAQNDPESFPLLLSTYDSWYGLKTTDFYQVIVAGIDNLTSYDEPKQVHGIVYKWLEQEVISRFSEAVVFSLAEHDHFAIVLMQPDQNILEILQKLANKLGNFFPFTLSFAIGNQVDSLDSMWFSYLKALETYQREVEEKKMRFIREYYAQGVQDVVQFIPSGHAKHFAKYILKELAYPKTKLNQELKQTLAVFMNNQGDLTRTARDAYLHRNTVRYRIEKVEAILGIDLSDPQASLNVRMALLLTEELS